MDSGGFKIGIFDSGKGGLSIVQALKKLSQQSGNELDIDFFADTNHFPYGTKTKEELEQIIRHNIHSLVQRGARCIIVACNTASIAGRHIYPKLEQELKIPILRVAESINKNHQSNRIMVIGTNFTILSSYYQDKLKKTPETALVSFSFLPLADAIENEDQDAIEKHLQTVKKYIEEYTCDAVLLGCTHYSLIHEKFRSLLPAVTIMDPSWETARLFINQVLPQIIATDSHPEPAS
ncbi:hypothetical protein HGA88_01555 [Candidatus Roizmanbacteria bacterium]|nr:hypothetical protein [Candidatus Roizmanbacteria bacterium]